MNTQMGPISFGTAPGMICDSTPSATIPPPDVIMVVPRLSEAKAVHIFDGAPQTQSLTLTSHFINLVSRTYPLQ